jgi:hypothetical protein
MRTHTAELDETRQTLARCMRDRETLIKTLEALRLEVMHYRKTGIGQPFLDSAIDDALAILDSVKGGLL